MAEQLPAPAAFPAPINGQPDLLIIAGEHSGDEHAALLVADLRAKNPDLKVACLGGVELQAAGAQLLYDLTAVSIVGFVEVVKHFGFFRSLFNLTLDWIERYQPKHVCFVDYPGFNLRLADRLAKRGLSQKGGGDIGVSYYIGPQVWAWKAKRRFTMERVLDRLGVIFRSRWIASKTLVWPLNSLGTPLSAMTLSCHSYTTRALRCFYCRAAGTLRLRVFSPFY